MNFETFAKKIEKLKSTHYELLEEYENVKSESIYDCMRDLYMMYDKLSKVHSNIDPSTVVRTAIHKSIACDMSIYDSMNDIVTRYLMPGGDKSILQQYFNEISRIYDKNNNDYNIEYCPGNRDKLIEMNLKTVISVAKGYQGLGLSLEDLISAGNLGLVTSFDKYDPNKAKLKEDMLNTLNDIDDGASNIDIINNIHKYLMYGDIKKKFIKSFAVDPSNNKDIEKFIWKSFTKKDIEKWIKKNVKNATFNSVAFMWIRAFILIEIDNYSRLVKKPKTEIYNDKIKYGAYKKEITLDIDAPVGEDSDTCFGDILNLDNEHYSNLEISEAYDSFKSGLDILLEGVKPRDRAVFLKKFGIGLPRPMLPKEIAEQENLSIARISQIFQSVIEQMQKNAQKHNINPDILFDAVRKLN